MSAWVQAYLGMQVLLVVGWMLSRASARTLSAPVAVATTRVFLVAAVVMPMGWALVGTDSPWRPAPQVFQALDAAGAGAWVSPLAAATQQLQTSVAVAARPGPWLWVLLVAALTGIAAVIRAWSTLARIIDDASPDGTHDDIEVRVSQDIAVPFAARLPGRRVIVLDPTTATHADDRRIALAHEHHHHTQHDTLFTYAHALLRVSSPFNPFAWWWARDLEDLEELATDAAVVDSGVGPREYGECLLRAAERECMAPSPAFAVSLTARGARSLLHRRIVELTRPRRGAAAVVPLTVVGLSVMTATAWSADRLLDEGGLADSAVTRLASHRGPHLPPPEILEDALRTIAGNAESVRFLERGVARSSRWTPQIHEELDALGMPRALAAIPLIESGYANLQANPRATSMGAGLWMFVPGTAMAYGLDVEPTLDQRLDPQLQTEAALRLLLDLHLEFDDWALAITAYNQGRMVVRRAVENGGSSDPWELVEQGSLSPYAAQVMAASLLMEQPELFDRQDPWLGALGR